MERESSKGEDTDAHPCISTIKLFFQNKGVKEVVSMIPEVSAKPQGSRR